jgi:hypothetical protein
MSASAQFGSTLTEVYSNAARRYDGMPAFFRKEKGGSLSHVTFEVSFLFGGQIAGDRMRLFMIYSAGNFIECSQDAPYFQIGGRGSLGAHTSKGEAFSLATFGPAARAQLDIVEIVPWLELAPSLYVLSGEGADAAARPGLSTGLGIEVLLDPSWSLGMSAHYHRVTGEERFPAWMQLGATLGWRTVLGNPLAP